MNSPCPQKPVGPFLIIAFSVSLLGPRESSAGVMNVIDGTATLTFTSGFSGAADPVPFVIPHVDVTESPQNSFTSHVNDPSSAGYSDAKGGISAFALPDVASFNLPAGMGVSQFAPSGSAAAATLREDFNINYQIDSAGFGPGLYNFYNVYIQGNNGSVAGSFGSFHLNFVVSSLALGVAAPVMDVADTFTTPGAFSKEYHAFPAVTSFSKYPANDVLNITGFITFQTKAGSIELSRVSGATVPEPGTLVMGGMVMVIGLFSYIRVRNGGEMSLTRLRHHRCK